MITQEKLWLFAAPIVGFWVLSAFFSVVARTPAGQRAQLQPGGWIDPSKERASALFVGCLVASQQLVQVAMNAALEILQGTAQAQWNRSRSCGSQPCSSWAW